MIFLNFMFKPRDSQPQHLRRSRGSQFFGSVALCVACLMATYLVNAWGQTTPTRPANDNFANAQVISGTSGSVTGSNVNATQETGEPINYVSNTSIWYSWKAPATKPFVFDTKDSNFNTMLSVSTGTGLGTLTPISSGPDAVYFDAVAGTTYQIVVSGVESSYGYYSSGASGTVILNWNLNQPVPPVFYNMSAVAGDRQVTLRWLNPSSIYSSFQVYRSITPGNPSPTPVATVLAPLPQTQEYFYVSSGLTNGQTYYFSIKTINANGTSGFTDELSAVPNLGLSAPQNLRAVPRNGSIELSWSVAAGADHYLLKRATRSGGPYTDVGRSPYESNYTDPNYVDYFRDNDTTYYYVVSAVSSTNVESPNSSQASATPRAGPTGGANLQAIPGNGQVTLSWAPSTGITPITYTVSRSLFPTGKFSIVATGIASTSYLDSGLSNGTTYYYVVRATNPYGDGYYPDTVGAVPNAALSAPQNLKATPNYTSLNSRNVTLSWSAAAGAATYNVYRSTVNGGPYGASLGTVTAPRFVDPTVVSTTTYYYVVASVGSTGIQSAYSASVASNAPFLTNLTAVASNGQASVQLSWPVNADNHYSRVGRSTQNGGPYTYLTPNPAPTGNSYTDTTVELGKTYFYALEGVNGSGVATISNDAMAVTAPSAVIFSDVQPSSVMVLLPQLPSSATSFTLERAQQATPLAWSPVKTGLLGGVSLVDTVPNANATYWYRAVAVSSPNITGVAASVDLSKSPPAAPGVPRFENLTMTSLTVRSPLTMPVRAQSLKLQQRLGDDTRTPFTDVEGAGSLLANAPFMVSGLNPSSKYSFRYIALAIGTASAPGVSADATTLASNSGGAGGLLGSYYSDDRNFRDLVFNRIDPKVDFNWGDSGPGKGMRGVTYCVRWQGKLQPRYLEDYTFYTTADDGVRLWINGQLIIDKWGRIEGSSADDASAPIRLDPAQKYDVRLEYYHYSYTAQIKLGWSSASDPREIIPADRLYPLVPSTGTGLRGQYFSQRDFSGIALSRIDPRVDFTWASKPPMQGFGANGFSVWWTGKFQPRYSEAYTFSTRTNYGVRLWVNGQPVPVTDKWDTGLLDWSSTPTAKLVADQLYDIKMEFSNTETIPATVAQAHLMWSSPSQFNELVPQDRLFPASADSTPPPPPRRTNDAIFVSQQVPPRVLSGRSTPVSVTFRNSGTSTWISGSSYKLGSENPTDNTTWNLQRVTLPADVAPKTQVTFKFNITSPVTVIAGSTTSNFRWRMVQDTVEHFGDFSPNVVVNIDGPPPPPSVEDVGPTSVQLRMPDLPSYATALTLQRAVGTSASAPPPPTTGLQVWLKADAIEGVDDGAAVETWRDSSGGNRNATQSVNTAQPKFVANALNGRPVVRFDGVDDYLQFPEQTGLRSVFAVVKHATGTQTFAPLLGHPTLYDFHGGEGALLFHASATSTNVLNGKAYINGVDTPATAMVKPTSYSITSLLTSGPVTAANLSKDRGEARFWNGDYAEVLLYNTLLSDTQRTQVEEYLRRKYAIDINAPAGAIWTTVPGATGLAGGAVYNDTNCTPSTLYWYRTVLEMPGGNLAGSGRSVTTLPPTGAPPDAPGAPAAGVPSPNSIDVTAPGPSLPARANSLKLQMKLPNDPDSSYADIATGLNAGSISVVGSLDPSTTYRFRYAAVGTGGVTASAAYADYTTTVPAPDVPGVPQFGSITTDAMTVYLPPLPPNATSFRLEYYESYYLPFVLVPVAPSVPAAAPGSTNLPTEAVVRITGLAHPRTYNFRCVAVGPGGSTPSGTGRVYTGARPPNVPGNPTFRNIGVSNLEVVAPLMNDSSDVLSSFTLQGKLADQPEASYTNIASIAFSGDVTPATGLSINGLSKGTLYTFRYVAFGPGGGTNGPSASVRTATPVLAWLSDTPIECAGIRYPLPSSTTGLTQKLKVSSFLAVDWDRRDTTMGSGGTSSFYSDPCTYTWTASAGTFNNGAATAIGLSALWSPPAGATVGSSYTIRLVVDDQKGINKPGADGGSRGDASKSIINDDPLKFSVTVTIQ